MRWTVNLWMFWGIYNEFLLNGNVIGWKSIGNYRRLLFLFYLDLTGYIIVYTPRYWTFHKSNYRRCICQNFWLNFLNKLEQYRFMPINIQVKLQIDDRINISETTKNTTAYQASKNTSVVTFIFSAIIGRTTYNSKQRTTLGG